MNTYLGHLAVQQRVLPTYRAAFFDLLAQSCGRMGLFAGVAARRREHLHGECLESCRVYFGQEHSFVQRPALSLLSDGIGGLARKGGSRCVDRGSEPSLSGDFFRRKVDASPR